MKLLAFAAAFVAGTLLAFRIGGGAPLIALILFALAALFAALLLASLRRSPWLALIALAAILGVARVALISDVPPTLYASPYARQIEGVILSDVEALGSFARFRLRAERIQADGGEWTPASAELLVTARATTAMAQRRQAPYFRYGDRLQLRGRIREPPTLEGFDYAAYLARQGISEVMDAQSATLIGEDEGSAFYRRLYGLRQQLAASIAAVVPEPQSALAQATLLGLRRAMPGELTEAFRRTGTSHLLAISGLHIGILLSVSLAAAAAALGRKRYLHLIAPLVVIWLYALLSGMSPSATRACIMGSVYLASLAFGRQRRALAPLGCAAALMVAVSPAIIFSISFQLSFAALAGIAAFSDTFGDVFRALAARFTSARSALRPPLLAIADMLGVSLAATAATLPLIALHFERVSTIGIPASLLTLPALPLVILGSAAAALLGLVNTTLALPFGWLAWGAATYLSGVITLMAGLPNAAIYTGSLTPPVIAAYYAILLLAYIAIVSFPQSLRQLRERVGIRASLPDAASFRPRNAAIWLLIPAAFAASLAWSHALSRDDRLHVVFFDVGQGDAIFIETPGGRQVIIDGGPDPPRLAQLLGERMRFNDRYIDIVAATHPHSDHIGGLPQVLARYDVGAILERRIEHDSAAYLAWARAVDKEKAQGATVIEAQASQVITLDGDIRLEVLGPPATLLSGTDSDADNASLVLRLVYDEVSVLLTGDIFAAAERALLANGAALRSDALKVPHHGSDSSSTPAFLSAVSPAVAVISAGADNRFGHPHADVVQRLQQFTGEDMLFLTAERGAIELISDGKTLQIRAER